MFLGDVGVRVGLWCGVEVHILILIETYNSCNYPGGISRNDGCSPNLR